MACTSSKQRRNINSRSCCCYPVKHIVYTWRSYRYYYALVDEISYNLSLGNTVVLDGLGRFHLTVESDPVENKEDFDIKKNVKGVKCKFLPASRCDPKTRKSTQDFASGVQVVWADPEDEEE